mmetsp:Transcript_66462/g.172895  ORF Transcript_66462/g.172895 Transcript_66462/m.172895 type:complete len:341 (-) Transcript_66462:578-1600(-)
MHRPGNHGKESSSTEHAGRTPVAAIIVLQNRHPNRVRYIQPPPLVLRLWQRWTSLANGKSRRRHIQRNIRWDGRHHASINAMLTPVGLIHVPRGIIGRWVVDSSAFGVRDARVCVSQALAIDYPASAGRPEANRSSGANFLIGWSSQMGRLKHVVTIDIVVLGRGCPPRNSEDKRRRGSTDIHVLVVTSSARIPDLPLKVTETRVLRATCLRIRSAALGCGGRIAGEDPVAQPIHQARLNKAFAIDQPPISLPGIPDDRLRAGPHVQRVSFPGASQVVSAADPCLPRLRALPQNVKQAGCSDCPRRWVGNERAKLRLPELPLQLGSAWVLRGGPLSKSTT